MRCATSTNPSSKVAPDGSPDPSVFSTEANREGIQVGTAIATMVKRAQGGQLSVNRYRDLWGAEKRMALLARLDAADFDGQYTVADPEPANRYSFRPSIVSAGYGSWPTLVTLAGDHVFSGVVEKRRGALIDLDLNALKERIAHYANPQLSLDALRSTIPGLATDAARFRANQARERFLNEGGLAAGQFLRSAHHPLDLRHCFHSGLRPLWNEPRSDLAATHDGSRLLITTRVRARRPGEGVPLLSTTAIPNDHLLDPITHVHPNDACSRRPRQPLPCRMRLSRRSWRPQS